MTTKTKYPYKKVPGAEELTTGEIKTLLTLMHVVGRDGRASVRSVAAAEKHNVSSVHKRLTRLVELGYATKDPGRTSTYWPAVKAKAAG